MTVSQLIAELQKLPPDMEVQRRDSEYEPTDVSSVEVVSDYTWKTEPRPRGRFVNVKVQLPPTAIIG